ncbi:MAG TPA: tRNA (N(6)-L-threonylcarbamoyladenosine(37)-C(2))-methylthiotransferase MtaB [Thermodesulfovibrio thiophilus]|nr:tRNA (N(6)-L-threonylcarbamoyladenosine(37)-C(2))-methylthiotransferase MtaB [Thermodesulfovibrio thiophilus]
MKVCFITYGCKVNQAEALRWESLLRFQGYIITDNLAEADFWVINTCAVTQKAEIQSKQIINKARKLNKKTLVTGCYVELYKPQQTENLKIISNYKKDCLINYFQPINKTNTSNISRHRAIVKIQEGCNQFCSYCIVPYLRGKPRSYPAKEILHQIKDYEKMGIKEIVLSGVNLGLYGIGLEERVSLNSLIKTILKETSGFRMRLSSIEVNHINDEFLEIISDKRICGHLHIPLQHGSDRILNLMNRPYTIREFIERIEKILTHYPEISIGVDIIAGFPSETEKDFRKTLQLIENIGFSYLHAFTYSGRPFTKASELPEQIPENIKKERTNILIEIGKNKKIDYIKKFINSELEVIVENRKKNVFSGTSDNYIKCLIDNKELVEGSLIKAFVIGMDGQHCLCK